MSYKLIFCKSYKYEEAINLEHYLHKNLLSYRYNGRTKLIKDGSRELYKMDVLDKIIELLGLQESDLLSKAI